MSAQDSTSPTTLPELPWAFIDCPTDTLVILISHMLDLLIQHNDQVILTPDSLTRFHSRAAPGISVIEYLRRIVKYTNMEKIPLLSLLAYIDITCQHLPTFTLSSLTVHRFLIAGVCAGSKAQCDVFCTNAHYAKVGGIKVQELNALEREFLKVTQWNVNCNADLLQRYYSSLIRSHGGYSQAPPPAKFPFTLFPRSQSKPRPSEPVDDTAEFDAENAGKGEVEADEDMEGDESGSEYGSSPVASSSKRQSLDIPMKDKQVVSPSPTSMRGRSRHRRRRSGHSIQASSGTAMDVDPPDDRSSASSIPSSSRSSIRGSRGGGRGRALSFTYSDPKLAEPKVDTTQAIGQGAAWVPDVPPPSQGIGIGIGEEDEQHHHSQNHNHHHHHVGGKLLRNLVGGIFHHNNNGGGDHNHKHPPQSTATMQTTTTTPTPLHLHLSQPPQPESTQPPPAPNPTMIKSPPLPKTSTSTSELPRAIPITPKVRTRSEVSIHIRPSSAELDEDNGVVALGPSTVQGFPVAVGASGSGSGQESTTTTSAELGIVVGDIPAGGIVLGQAGDVVDTGRGNGKRGRLV